MPVIPTPVSGSDLDRRIARLVDGLRNGAEPLAYSTDECTAEALTALLEKRGITSTVEQDADYWYCVFWAPRPGDGVLERVASGSAALRALAICRAVMNLPLTGRGSRLRLRRASRGWIGPDDAEPRPAREHETDEIGEDAGSFAPPRAARES